MISVWGPTTMENQTSVMLLDLPEELLRMLAKYLGSIEVVSLSRTCKYLYGLHEGVRMAFKRQHMQHRQEVRKAREVANNILKTWLLQHAVNPYPTQDQKTQLAEATGLTVPQINTWFANGRRRILRPIQGGALSQKKGPMEVPVAPSMIATLYYSDGATCNVIFNPSH